MKKKYDFGGLEFYSGKICLHEEPQCIFCKSTRKWGT